MQNEILSLDASVEYTGDGKIIGRLVECRVYLAAIVF